jgi:hypothetical protein
MGGLLEAMAEFNLIQRMILTYDQEDTKNSDGKIIIIKPVWTWILEGSSQYPTE